MLSASRTSVGGHPSGPAGVALGTSGDSPTPPLSEEDGRRQERRSERARLKVVQRRLSPSKSSRQCWFPSASNVSISIGRQVTAQVSGVLRCGSSWSCPSCAPVVRDRRARQVEQGVGHHLANGGGALLVTLTSRHHRRDPLAPRLSLLAQALNGMLKGASWTRYRDRLGYVGTIKALEITYGYNGWHPHAHILFLFDRPVTEAQREAFERWVYGRWLKLVQAAGFGTVTPEHGVDVRQVDSIDTLADYLTKVEGKGGRSWSVGMELARSDLKRGGDSLVPFDLLAGFVATGDADLADLWQEYEEATFGKRALRWSPGLQARLGVEEISDVEAAASEGVDTLVYFRWLVEAQRWKRLLKAGDVGGLLTACEQEAARRFHEADQSGVELAPLLDHQTTDHIGEEP